MDITFFAVICYASFVGFEVTLAAVIACLFLEDK